MLFAKIMQIRGRRRSAVLNKSYRELVRDFAGSDVIRCARERSENRLSVASIARRLIKAQAHEIKFNMTAVLSVGGYIFIAAAGYGLVNNPSEALLDGRIGYAIIVSLSILSVWYVMTATFTVRRRLTMDRILRQMVYLSLEVDLLTSPRHVYRQGSMIARIERCARMMEQFPATFWLHRDEESAILIVERCRRAAAQLRYWKVSVAMPAEVDTLSELKNSIADVVDTAFSGRWFDLPGREAPINRRINLLSRLGWGAVAILLLGALVLLAIKQSEFGATGTIMASILALLIVIVLSRLGVSIASLQQVADVADKMKIKGAV